MDLLISPKIIIPSQELDWRFSRSSGPGGQKVNKTDSKVELVFSLSKSKILSEIEKSKIRKILKKKLINDAICISVKEKRTQYQNRKIALSKLANILKSCLFKEYKNRISTLPSYSSQIKRLKAKKKRGDLKKNRGANNFEL